MTLSHLFTIELALASILAFIFARACAGVARTLIGFTATYLGYFSLKVLLQLPLHCASLMLSLPKAHVTGMSLASSAGPNRKRMPYNKPHLLM